MKMNKEQFLKTEFGGELESTITAWDDALSRNREDKEVLRTLAWCQAQWEVYRMAIKHFYGVEYHFTRTDEYIESNEWWIADNHTFDVMVKDKNGNIHRPYLTAFLDARSGIFTGFHITYNPCSEATLIALRKGILKYGIPDNIYVDNGREFLTFDIGGLGHRKKKPKDGEEKFEPPGVFKRLGINMTNAIVRNAKAKIIERRFEDVKNDLSRLFNTYTGGSVVEKPERLKFVLKKDQIYTDEEFEEYVTAVLEWYFNMEAYNGAVEADKGKCKIEIIRAAVIVDEGIKVTVEAEKGK